MQTPELFYKMTQVLNEKLSVIKALVREQLNLLEAYDHSLERYDELSSKKQYEKLDKQKLDLDLQFLSLYRQFLEQHNAKKLEEIETRFLQGFAEIQNRIKTIEVLEEHIKLQRKMLDEIAFKSKANRVKMSQMNRVKNAYTKMKK